MFKKLGSVETLKMLYTHSSVAPAHVDSACEAPTGFSAFEAASPTVT